MKSNTHIKNATPLSKKYQKATSFPLLNVFKLLSIIIFGTIAILLLLISVQSNISVEKDKQSIRQIANRLGLTSSDLITEDRQTSSFEESYDVLYSKYSTNLSFSEFLNNSISSGIIRESDAYSRGRQPSCDIISRLNYSKYIKVLKLGDKYTLWNGDHLINFPENECPLVSQFSGNLNGQYLNVFFIESNQLGEKWTYDGKILKKNIVFFDLERRN